ncbi:hypothetical protein B0H34DRAFT_713316 [Crassisporium funariophilum]|nr:hypothetical protein B0H34DRAFT_713316 [Crassisporium funariophilum]
MVDTGLLFVFGECGPKVTEEEFNDWYNNEHGPARLTVPGFSNAIRYKATDSRTPSWLALYDLASPAVVSSDGYKSLASKASDRERALIPRLANLNRRVYDSISVLTNPTNPANCLPGGFILVVTMLVGPELEDEFNKWYEEEHMPDLSRLSGWLRGRRYKLVDSVELAAKPVDPKPVHNYLAIHEFDHDDYFDTAEFNATLETTRSAEMLKQVTFDARRFALHKNIQRS